MKVSKRLRRVLDRLATFPPGYLKIWLKYHPPSNQYAPLPPSVSPGTRPTTNYSRPKSVPQHELIHQQDREWHEWEHPRVPAGGPKGGEFTDKLNPSKSESVNGVESATEVDALEARWKVVPSTADSPEKEATSFSDIGHRGRVVFENPFPPAPKLFRDAPPETYTISIQPEERFDGERGLSIRGLDISKADRLLPLLEYGLSLHEQKMEVRQALEAVDTRIRNKGRVVLYTVDYHRDLVNARLALEVQDKLLDELISEAQADFDEQGFDVLEIIGIAAGRDTENRLSTAGGRGFGNAVKAFRMSLETVRVRGLEPTYIEFDWPLLGSTAKFSVKAFLTLFRRSPVAAVRKFAGTFNGSVTRFFDEVAKLGYAEAVKKAGARAAQIVKEFKGQLGEAAAQRTLQRAGYTQMPAKYGTNNGLDGVFVKYATDGTVKDIIILESKSRSKIPALLSKRVLSNTRTRGIQLSEEWFKKTMDDIAASGDAASQATRKILLANKDKIRLKVNVLDPNGVNRWNRAKLPEWNK